LELDDVTLRLREAHRLALEHGDDLAVSRCHGLGSGRHARVRLVDHAVPGGGERGHQRHPEHRHRRVVHRVGLALPRGCVEDGAPFRPRDGGRMRKIELGTADADEPAVVELEQVAPVPDLGRLARDEHPVVGLGLVARHRDLVALAVVHVDVQRTGPAQQLEVRRGVVDVQAHPSGRAGASAH
jgi:hypothetical protein